MKKLVEKLVPHREIIVRGPSSIRHMSLSSFAQFFLVLAVVGVFAWGSMATYVFLSYDKIIEENKKELTKSKDDYRKLLAEVSAYHDQIEKISEKINKSEKVTAASKKIEEEAGYMGVEGESATIKPDNRGAVMTAFKTSFYKFMAAHSKGDDDLSGDISDMEKERLRGDVQWLEKKLDALSSGKTRNGAVASSDALNVELSKAELQRDLALSEARNLRNKVMEMEALVDEMQKTQVVIFNKVANLAEDGIGAIEKKLSGVKDALNKVGLGFETLLARVNIEYRDEGATGGPFIPVSLSTPVTPDLKNDVLNVSLTNLNGYVSRWNSLTKLEEKLPIGKPVDKVRITSRFGVRNDPFNRRQAIHEGLDFGGIRGEAIYATAGGKVIYAGLAGSFGYMVEIDHGLGIRTRYAHLNSIDVKRGDKISTGQKVATMGNTGRSTGVHLHYEVRMKGTPLDPLNFVRIDRNVSKKY